MPPRSDAVPLNDNDQAFLVECIKSSKEKLVPDFSVVSNAMSMSKGGAANKFRTIMKRFEAAGATSSGEDTATIKPAPKKGRPAASKKTTKDKGGENDSEDVEPPQKKTKTTKAKAPAKPKAGVKKGVARKKAPAKSEKNVGEDGASEDGENGDGQDEDGDVKDEEESV